MLSLSHIAWMDKQQIRRHLGLSPGSHVPTVGDLYRSRLLIQEALERSRKRREQKRKEAHHG